MKTSTLLAGTLAMLSNAANASEELCYVVADTSLYADAGLSDEVRPIFQFDGAQFVPSAKDGEVMFGMAYDVRMQPMLEESSYVRASDWSCEVLVDVGYGENGVTYDVSENACQQEFSDTRVAFSGSSITFYESACDIILETSGSDGARLFSLQCYGEGAEWQAQASMVTLDGGAIRIKFDDQDQTYVPCG